MLEEYVGRLPRSHGPEVPVAITLSARTAEQLRQRVEDLLGFVLEQLTADPPLNLPAMAFTLQVGREAMEHRLALLAGSAQQLAASLQAWLAGEQQREGLYQGQARRNEETVSLFRTDAALKNAIEQWMAAGKLTRLLELWVKGLDLDWNQLYSNSKPNRISLPAYPFARQRHWVDEMSMRPAEVDPFVSGEIMQSIEKIIDQIDEGGLDSDHGARLLKVLV